ncbi:hypothetical protein, partial [Escherichia coli]|uniref:hypothetical protein n=1 Tax=Escherichia coli TaxID=562 RepID=UPI0010556170
MATGDFASGGSFSPSAPASLVERVERIQASAFIAAAIYDEDHTTAGAGAHTIASNQSILADLW